MNKIALHKKIVGIIANTSKLNTEQMIKLLLKTLDNFGVNYILEKNTADFLNIKNGLGIKELTKNVEWLIVIGGDGTIMQTIHQLNSTSLPILGVNLKTSFGFLTETYESHFHKTMEDIINGDFRYIERSTFTTEHYHADGIVKKYPRALNDVTFTHSGHAKMVEISVKINGNYFTNYLGDGVIFATASGSTAHSLSAGGPIMYPDTDAFLITPICPHTLSQRPIILPRGYFVDIEAVNNCMDIMNVNVSVDGIVQAELKQKEFIKLTLGEHVLFINSVHHNFVNVLQNKLHWSGKMHKTNSHELKEKND